MNAEHAPKWKGGSTAFFDAIIFHRVLFCFSKHLWVVLCSFGLTFFLECHDNGSGYFDVRGHSLSFRAHIKSMGMVSSSYNVPHKTWALPWSVEKKKNLVEGFWWSCFKKSLSLLIDPLMFLKSNTEAWFVAGADQNAIHSAVFLYKKY